MTQVIRYGIIGTGMMGIEHIENIAAIDGAIVDSAAKLAESTSWNYTRLSRTAVIG